VSEGAVSDKPLWFYGLARNRRSPKRPPEPRWCGAHLEEDGVRKRSQTATACILSKSERVGIPEIVCWFGFTRRFLRRFVLR
jgi:hypothetical protein